MEEHFADLYDEADPIEAYCVRCRQSVFIEDPQPVWTRRGLPATRGDCSQCGGTVFRMGRTDAHSGERPEPVQVSAPNPRVKLVQETAYINYSERDAAAAEEIAADLQKSGLAVWMHTAQAADVQWASGVHPALQECARMVLLLSPEALQDTTVEAAWRFFKLSGKRIVIAQVAAADPPDGIRRSPRFDFVTQDYKRTLRGLLEALTA